ncbi:MAG: phosphonate C-P lyase system protein PhnG [Pseudorhodobacter sp.]|nr:phosphonate C-P lyase system protein PhnG [Pseudorhodobacter sp.]
MTQTLQTKRQGWMGLFARAKPDLLALLMPDLVPHDVLRGPEVGAVMVRGRVGGTGQPFNLGEMTVTRCSVRVGDAVGHAHVQGRDKAHALRAAVLDALMQTDMDLQARVLVPLEAKEAAHRSLRAAKAAATKVEFFTLVRGEDK